MAIRDKIISGSNGINFTKETDSSADWPSIANSTYFRDVADGLIHYKNSAGTVLEIYGASGLTYFTEAQNTTAPNATVPVDSLTAITATTNGDVAIVPKGTGAFSLAVADSLVAGGNKRGTNAIDLQTIRNVNSQVAGGARSFTAGSYNTASADDSYAIGKGNVASGYYTVAIGLQSTASGSYANAFGFSNLSSGQNSFSNGYGNTASGGYAVAIGNSNTASGAGAVAMGAVNTNAGPYSAIFGYANTISGTGYTFKSGYGNTGTASYSITTGYNNAVSGEGNGCFGSSSTVSNDYAFSLGYQNLASGLQSFAIGKSCTASSTGTVALGNTNTSSGNLSYTFGSSCTASNANAIAMGNRAKATGDSSICLASNFYGDSTASGQNSIVLGAGTASSTRSMALGFSALVANASSTAIGDSSNTFNTVGRIALSGGSLGNAGDNQKGVVSYRQRTTNATPTILTTNNAVAFNDNAGSQLALQNQQVMRFKGSITAKQSGTTDIAVWDIDGVIVRGANIASTVLTVSNVNVVTNIPLWVTPILAANLSTSVGGLMITVTGVVATNIQWFAVLDTVENIYA